MRSRASGAGTSLRRVQERTAFLELLEAGQTQAEILAGYPQLKPFHIKAALHYAAELVDGAHAPAAR